MAADAKLNFDDNAAFRQKEIFAMRDTTQEDPREVCCRQLSTFLYDITSVELHFVIRRLSALETISITSSLMDLPVSWFP